MKKQQNKFMPSDSGEDFFELAQGTIAVSVKCNQNCYFCDRSSAGNIADEAPGIICERLKAIKKTSDTVTFTGGEPTINRNLAAYIERAAELRFRIIRLETNGLMMSYPEYAHRICSAGLTHIVFMQVSRDPAISDAVTQFAGGWELASKGIESIAGSPVKAAVSIPILKQTLADIEQHVKFIKGRFPHVENIFLSLIRTGESGREGVSAAELEAMLPQALNAAGEAGIGLHFSPGDAPA
ncbi:MAG: radical SAM protein, partial [bacterium]